MNSTEPAAAHSSMHAAPTTPAATPAATPSATPVAGHATSAETSPAPATPDPRLGELEAEVARLKDQLLRTMADADNQRRRAEKERQDTIKYAAGNLARELLAVADTLERGVAAAKAAATPDAVHALAEGMQATERLLQQAFASAGIKKLEPLGQPFDPNFHRVMTEISGTGKPAGMVVQVLQAGYAIHDRLLREAMVAVAKADGAEGAGASHTLDTKA